MCLVDFLRDKFRDGISYEDAVDVCIAIYCARDIIPAGIVEDEQLSMDVIANAFADISAQGLITGYSAYKSVSYGANYHSIEDKGHWIEVQASTLKLNTTYDEVKVRALMRS